MAKLVLKSVVKVLCLGLLLCLMLVGATLLKCFLGPAVTKKRVTSPDGRCQAYIRYRGWLDSTRGRLYVRQEEGPILKGPTLSGADITFGEVVWSADSRRVAGLIWSQVPFGLERAYVFDVATGRSGWIHNLGGYLKTSGIDSPQSLFRRVSLEWLDSDTLVLTVKHLERSGLVARRSAAVF